MNNKSDIKNFELFCVVVDFGRGSKVLKIAKENGVSGGTIFLGKGTINNHLLKLLDLSDVRKEIVLMIADKEVAYEVLEELDNKIDFRKPNHGIAFTTSVANLIGTKDHVYNKDKESRGAENIMHNAIFVIVDKGRAEDAIDAAVAAGSRGGTIINARGSGTHENNKLFAMAIEPEKEIVMILSEKDSTENIIRSIREKLKIDEPGNGVIFTLDINNTYGLY